MQLTHNSHRLLLAALLSGAPSALARTDFSGCTSSTVYAGGGASLLYWVPGTGEICSLLDCGGGAGAPITTQPGCADYQGTATLTPSYLPGYGPGASTGIAAAAAQQTAASQWPSVSVSGPLTVSTNPPTMWTTWSQPTWSQPTGAAQGTGSVAPLNNGTTAASQSAALTAAANGQLEASKMVMFAVGIIGGIALL